MAVAALGFAGAVLALRELRPFPPVTARPVLIATAVLLALLAFLVGRARPTRARAGCLLALGAIAAAAPIAMATWVPGVAQPREHPIPGGPDLVVSAAPYGSADLYLLPDGDANRLVALTETPDVQELYPRLSSDGAQVAYITAGPDGGSELHLLELDRDRAGTDRLVMSSAGILSEIAWAPSGSYLLVRSDAVDRGARILELDVATGDVRSSIANAINPALSPDGTRMAFARQKGEDPDSLDIVVANADGSHRRSVIDTAGEDWGPYWSPDGRWISFTSTLHGGDPDVYVARADGSEVRNLTSDSLAADRAFGWGPEGHILFLSDRSGTGGTFLYFMNPDGSGVRLALIL